MPDQIKDNLQKHLGDEERLYNQFCGTCHQLDGLGSPGRYPPLLKTKRVKGEKEQLVEIVLTGMQGPIEVAGQKYNAVMPPLQFLSDAKIAKILTFIRSNFADGASPITENEVADVRKKMGGGKL